MTHSSDILVNRVKQQHECQTKCQQWSEAVHCVFGGWWGAPLLLGHNVYLISSHKGLIGSERGGKERKKDLATGRVFLSFGPKPPFSRQLQYGQILN